VKRLITGAPVTSRGRYRSMECETKISEDDKETNDLYNLTIIG
jgi:hypothetical protein